MQSNVALTLKSANVKTGPIPVSITGADFIGLTWGENWIDLTQDTNGNWSGIGWFKEIGGDWVARELNHCPKKALNHAFGDPVAFLRDHFTVISIK